MLIELWREWHRFCRVGEVSLILVREYVTEQYSTTLKTLMSSAYKIYTCIRSVACNQWYLILHLMHHKYVMLWPSKFGDVVSTDKHTHTHTSIRPQITLEKCKCPHEDNHSSCWCNLNETGHSNERLKVHKLTPSRSGMCAHAALSAQFVRAYFDFVFVQGQQISVFQWVVLYINLSSSFIEYALETNVFSIRSVILKYQWVY